MPDIDPTPLEKSFVVADGQRMAYHERGTGETVVFLHGNPTSSYLWRNVIPHVEPFARCLAPDLIGMGDSAKVDDAGPGSYRFVEHRRFLDAWLDAVAPGGHITFVLHDWGSALGFDWARRHPERVAGIAYMEAIFPMRWDQFPEGARELFQMFRTDAGEELILRGNTFVEGVLPGAVLRDLTDEEMAEYRRPFLDRAGSLAHSRVAARAADRGCARRHRRDRRGLHRVALDVRRPEAVRERRARRAPHRRATGAGAAPPRTRPR